MTSTRSLRKNPSGFRVSFFWHWHKNWVLTLIYTILLLVALPASFFLQLLGKVRSLGAFLTAAERGAAELSMAEDMSNQVLVILTWVGVPLLTLMGLLLAISSFGYLHNRRSVDLFGALPVRRLPMLLGGMTANLLQMLLPLALSLAIVQALGWGYGDLVYPFSAQLLWQPFGLMALTGFVMYLIFLFMVVVSGTLLDAALSYGILAAGWPALLACVENLCRMSLPGYTESLSIEAYTLFLPVIQLITYMSGFSTHYCYLTYPEEGVPQIDTGAMPIQVDTSEMIWWAVLAVLMLVLVAVCFRIRRNEYAESTDAFPMPRACLRLLASLVGGLGLGFLFGNILYSNLLFAFGVLLGAFLAHLITQAIWQRGLKGFARTLPAYGLAVALLAGGVLAVCYDLTGYVTRVPQLSEVDSVILGDSYYAQLSEESSSELLTGEEGGRAYLAERGSMELNCRFQDGSYQRLAPRLTEEESIQSLLAVHKAVTERSSAPYLPFGSGEGDDAGHIGLYLNLTLTYTLKSGETIQRTYYNLGISKETAEILSRLTESREYQEINALNYYNGTGISGITREQLTLMGDSEGHGYYYSSNDGGYKVCYDLTGEEQQQLWSTFLRELQSDSFVYDRNEGDFDSMWRESKEGLREAVTDYRIELGELERAEFSNELLAVLEKRLGKEADSVIAICWSGYIYVPQSCVETRALMDSILEAHAGN